MRKLITLMVVLLAWPVVVPAADNNVIAIIVQRNQVTHQMDTAELALIFWRKKLYWADSKPIQAVNLATDSPIRRQFSQKILGGLPESQTDYWNTMYFHGISPPHVVTSQEGMLRFVTETAGAIGYIDACKMDDRIKTVAWVTANGTVTTSQPALDCN
ncbi:MAG: hypothetical protein ACAH12_01000 [Methylophilaceae bacterium]